MRFGGDVQHVMHTVHQVDVSHAGRPEHDSISWGLPTEGMTGAVVRPKVSLCFHDHSAQSLTPDASHQSFAQQVPGDGQGVPVEKRMVQE